MRVFAPLRQLALLLSCFQEPYLRCSIPHRTAFAVAMAVLGCSGSAVEKVKLVGVVRPTSGRLATGGSIAFVPLAAAAGKPLRPGWAVFSRDGRFQAGSHRAGDGLVPGRYAVRIECSELQTPGSDIISGPTYSHPAFEFDVPKFGGRIYVEWIVDPTVPDR
jgi:hypothetical protein